MDLLKKLLEREAYIPLLGIIAATLMMALGKVNFGQWAGVLEVLTGISVGALTVRKAAESIGGKS